MFSRHGARVWLCVFGDTGEQRHELKQREGDMHHGFVTGLKAGAKYGFRVEGPWAPDSGLRYDPTKLLIDPFAWEFDGAFVYHTDLSVQGADTAARVPKAIISGLLSDVVRVPYRKPEFIYELSVKAFTKLHPGVPEKLRGTVAALAEPVMMDHLKKIGVDTIELMPLTAWIDERHLHSLGLNNAWGYNPVQFFAPDLNLAPGGLAEIRKTIATLHENGFRMIMDIVLNHTGEGDEFGPTLCLRGFDSALYYAHAGGKLINDTGCGNTVALNQPHIVDMVIRALRHWVLKVGVDGFRFDLGTVMGRVADGFSPTAPLLQAIEDDPVLSTCVMIAEPWDVGPGGYQLGQFPKRWLEWNDRYRDDVRTFWRGDDYSANSFATRLAGSSEVFKPPRKPSSSVNFIAAHDGFTFYDLIKYTDKNNYNNGEENRDGKSQEVTWPAGNVRALLATLFLSRGTPMLTAGDEFGRTQGGNNNAYAQDNDITWLNWQARDISLIDDVAVLVRLRSELRDCIADEFLVGLNGKDTQGAIWFDADGQNLDWAKAKNCFVGLMIAAGDKRFAIATNGSSEKTVFKLEADQGQRWSRIYPASGELMCPAQSISVFQQLESSMQ